RRRHTRSKRDWSSDVCSSDLAWHNSPNSSPTFNICLKGSALCNPLCVAHILIDSSITFIPTPQFCLAFPFEFLVSRISSTVRLSNLVFLNAPVHALCALSLFLTLQFYLSTQ